MCNTSTFCAAGKKLGYARRTVLQISVNASQIFHCLLEHSLVETLSQCLRQLLDILPLHEQLIGKRHVLLG